MYYLFSITKTENSKKQTSYFNKQKSSQFKEVEIVKLLHTIKSSKSNVWKSYDIFHRSIMYFIVIILKCIINVKLVSSAPDLGFVGLSNNVS